MEELEKNETSTQSEENTVSLASAQALADALAKIEVYTPTTWVDNSSPDIDAEHLNKPEQAIKRVTDALNSAVDVIKDLQSQVTKNAGDISTVNNNLSNRWTLYGAEIIPNNADMYTYTEPGNYACATNAVAATLKNCPLSRAFDLKVYRSAGGKTDGYIIQEYTAHDAKQRVLVPYDPYASKTKWGNPIFLATKDDLTPTDYSVTAGNGKSIVFNKSYKVGNLIIIAAKIKVTTTENTLLTFADSPKNQGAVFLLGKGGEYSVSSAIYGYIGNRAILTQSNQIAAGDYVHVHGVVVL